MNDTQPPEIGADAPPFSAPVADDDGIAPRPLAAFVANTPVVLAFYPAAFSNTCTAEFCTFRDQLGPLAANKATVLGISTDLPWALAAFRKEESLPFPLVSDNDGSISGRYGVRTSYERLDIDSVAQRSVFVVDADGIITYRWLADSPGMEPDYEEVAAAVKAVTNT